MTTSDINEAIDKATAQNPNLGAIVTLPDFLGTVGELTLEERTVIIDQALVLIDDLYVHLPLKRAMHAIDPVQSLKLLKRRLPRITERQFHNEMITIFKGLRDLHTNYMLPEPYNQNLAFLPFYMEEYYDNDQRHYIVSKLIAGFQHDTFVPGVEVTHWNGVPIDRAVELSAEREAGSNEPAQHVRGLDDMTVRSMSQSLPPDSEWVVVNYISNGNALEIKFPWRIYRPDPQPPGGVSTADNAQSSSIFSLGLDVNLEVTNRARKALFVPDSAANTVSSSAPNAQADANEPSRHPDYLTFQNINTAHGQFGYIRIRSFSLDPEDFIPEFKRALGLMSPNGLIIDVRANGGGIITNGERILKLFTDDPIETERLHFINTDLTQAIANSPAWGGFANRWSRSIELSLQTGAVYSQGFPIEPLSDTNSEPKMYDGKIVVITDARCYSTTDIFAAGFQDNKLGLILGVDNNTGAGGANVFGHDILQYVLQGQSSPIKPLPKGSFMRVSIRRTTRVGDNAGLPLEDLGVIPDRLHRMTLNDVLNGNTDLINEAARLLTEM